MILILLNIIVYIYEIRFSEIQFVGRVDIMVQSFLNILTIYLFDNRKNIDIEKL